MIGDRTRWRAALAPACVCCNPPSAKLPHCGSATAAQIPSVSDYPVEGIVDDAELLKRAATYREMAKQALRAELSTEFTARAERYEIAAQALKREGTKPRRP